MLTRARAQREIANGASALLTNVALRPESRPSKARLPRHRTARPVTVMSTAGVNARARAAYCSPGQQKAPEVVSAASRLGSPSGPFLPTSSGSSPPGFTPGVAGLECRPPVPSLPGGGPVPLVHLSGSRSGPSSGCSRPFRSFPPTCVVGPVLPGRSLPGTGPVFTGPRNVPAIAPRLQAGFCAPSFLRRARIPLRVVGVSAIRSSKRMVAGAATRRDPRQRSRSELENVAVMVEDWPSPAQLCAPSARRHAARSLRGSAPHQARAAQLQRRVTRSPSPSSRARCRKRLVYLDPRRPRCA